MFAVKQKQSSRDYVLNVCRKISNCEIIDINLLKID